jgi:hypothetical protein
MSPEARTLMEHGVQPTPGQMFGDGIVRRIEDKLTSAPLAGDIVTGARTRGMNQYNTVEINRALKPLGVAVTGAGEDAVEAASRAVSDAYDRVLPNVYMLPSSVMQATNAARASIKKIPLIDGAQEAKVGGYILQRIDPVIEAAQHGPIDGKTFKALDAEIGHYAREFSKTADPSHHALGEAFYELQTALRGALDAKTPDAGKLLKDTNAAYRNLLPVVKASDRAMAQGGRFTPLQLNRAAGQFGQEGSELNQAARRVLPNTIPNSGTADRIGIGAAFAAPVKTTVATSVAAVLYSRPGMALFIDGLSAIAPPGAIDAIKRLPPEGQRAAIEAFIREAPQIGGPLAAQVGRALATQEAAQ